MDEAAFKPTMFPPLGDYLARMAAYRIINEAERAQDDCLRLIRDGEAQLATERYRKWQDDVMLACAEMNRAAHDTIEKLRAELTQMMMSMPTPPLMVDIENKKNV